MQVLSGRWPALLLYYLKDGTKRFGELRRDNPTVSHRILTLELRKLEAVGILRRREYPGYPRKVEYDLTPAGRRLVPLLDALGDWWLGTEAERDEHVVAARLPGVAAGDWARPHGSSEIHW